jgi:hypothetical protein
MRSEGRIVRPEKPELVEVRLTVLVPQKSVPKEICEACGRLALCCTVVFEVTFEKTVSRKVCKLCLTRMQKSFEEYAPKGLVPSGALENLLRTMERTS